MLFRSPKDIFDIANGQKQGNAIAAKASFEQLGKVLGDVLANAVTLLDCNVVIGGGLSNAYPLFAPAMMGQLNGKISTYNGKNVNRLAVRAFDLENSEDSKLFFQNEQKTITIPKTNKQVKYNCNKKIGIGRTHLGTSKAVAIGAYAYALNAIDDK